MTEFELAVLERLDGIQEELAYHRKQDELKQATYEEEKAFAESQAKFFLRTG